MSNFAGIVLAVSLGLAALPQLLGRHLSRAAVMPGEAIRRTSIALTLVSIFLCGLAPFAAFVRVAIDRLIQSAVKVADLPSTMTLVSGLGWLDICGTHSANTADLSAACARVSGHKGVLRLHDLAFSTDAFLFAGGRVSGYSRRLADTTRACSPHRCTCGRPCNAGRVSGRRCGGSPLGSAGTAAAGRAVCRPRYHAGAFRLCVRGVFLRRYCKPSRGRTGAACGHDISGAGDGLYWRRFAGAGAIAAMLTGFAAAAIYIFGIRLAPVTFLDVTSDLSTAAPSALRKLAELRAAAEAADAGQLRWDANAALYRHALSIANWWGLKPAAGALFAVPLAFVAGVLATLMTRRIARDG